MSQQTEAWPFWTHHQATTTSVPILSQSLHLSLSCHLVTPECHLPSCWFLAMSHANPTMAAATSGPRLFPSEDRAARAQHPHMREWAQQVSWAHSTCSDRTGFWHTWHTHATIWDWKHSNLDLQLHLGAHHTHPFPHPQWLTADFSAVGLAIRRLSSHSASFLRFAC